MIRWIFVILTIISIPTGWYCYNDYYNTLDSKTSFKGLTITIEHRKGDTKSGTDVLETTGKKQCSMITGTLMTSWVLTGKS